MAQEMQRLEYVPTNVRMNYGPVLRKDNPLIADWVEAVNNSKISKPTGDNQPDRLNMLKEILAFLDSMIAKLLHEEEEEEEEEENEKDEEKDKVS